MHPLRQRPKHCHHRRLIVMVERELNQRRVVCGEALGRMFAGSPLNERGRNAVEQNAS